MTSLLRLHSTGPEVSAWKTALRGFGFLPADAFDAATESATRAFQRAAGVGIDGIVGPKTRAAAATFRAPPRMVPKVATPLTEEQLVDVLSAGHELAFGTLPSTPRLACAWAHVAHENGRGRAVWCHNLGNITAGGWRGSFYVIRVQERVERDPDVWEWVNLRFRTHASPAAGARDYWALMGGRYLPALAIFDEGKPAEAAWELSRLGFFTARAEGYARSMASLYGEFPG